MVHPSKAILQQTPALSSFIFDCRLNANQPLFNGVQTGPQSNRQFTMPGQQPVKNPLMNTINQNANRDGALRSTQAGHLVNTRETNNYPGSFTGSGNNSPKRKGSKLKRLFNKLRNSFDVRENSRYQQVPSPVPPAPRAPTNPVDLRHTTAIFDANPKNTNTMQQQVGLRRSFDQPRTGSIPKQQPNSVNRNFNIFDCYRNQGKRTGNNLNPNSIKMPTDTDPHEALFMNSNQAYPNIQSKQGGNAFAALTGNQGQQSTGQPSNRYEDLSSADNRQQSANKQNEHEKVKDDPSDGSPHLSPFDQKTQDDFHGKSMRSVQLYNTPTSASPKNLHPKSNPKVKTDSPISKPISSIPSKDHTSKLDIHADSCYNFLNKRRYKISDQQQTPLEAFFYKESMNQFKVVSALQRRQGYVQANNKVGSIRRNKRYLLVLDIDETIVHSEPIVIGGQQTGAGDKQFDRTLKFKNNNGTKDVYGVTFRPFLKEFIERMSKLYDLAVYTASAKDYADAVMDTIDPNRSIFCAILSREHCIPVAGMNIKNMANFDGHEAFIVDNLIYSYAFQMKQGIPICAFVDDPMDVELEDLAEILKNLPFYESLPALLQDMLGLDELYQNLSNRLDQ